MRTKLSKKGQIVIPGPLRRALGLEPGDSLNVTMEADRIVLVRSKKRARKARIVNDPITGLPVLTAGAKAPRLTSKQVRAFPIAQ